LLNTGTKNHEKPNCKIHCERNRLSALAWTVILTLFTFTLRNSPQTSKSKDEQHTRLCCGHNKYYKTENRKCIQNVALRRLHIFASWALHRWS